MAVTGMAGVLLWTSAERYGAMRDFYVEVLGLEPATERDQRVRFTFAGDTRLILKVHDQVHGEAGDPLRMMLNLAVDDASAMVDRVLAAGGEVLRQAEAEDWGGRIATVTDPDGNLVQFFELG